MHTLLHLFLGNSFCCYREWDFFFSITFLTCYFTVQGKAIDFLNVYSIFNCSVFIHWSLFPGTLLISLSALITCPDFPRQLYNLQITMFLVLSIVYLTSLSYSTAFRLSEMLSSSTDYSQSCHIPNLNGNASPVQPLIFLNSISHDINIASFITMSILCSCFNLSIYIHINSIYIPILSSSF